MINLNSSESTGTTAMESFTDQHLVSDSLTGDREAFGRIVARYQTLICSIAYSRTGSYGQSEDLAQETFLVAWQQLDRLREPHKLRAWLCGIVRHLTCDALTRQGREPSHAAETLEEITESPAPGPLPTEQTITNEELAILWRSLERIPEIYREPLVLFYREHQSISAVAERLDLTEDTVKQRLSRGRKLLHDQVLAFVEGALERTNPGKVFTLAVLAALPSVTLSAKAATLGAAAAKGSATAKAAGALGLFSAILSPLLVIFGNYASYRMSMDEAHTDEERGRIKTLFQRTLLVSLAISALLAGPLFWFSWMPGEPAFFWAMLFSQTIVIYFLTLAAFSIGSLARRRRYLATLLPPRTEPPSSDLRSLTSDLCFPPSAYEYRSRWTLLGLPLIHVRLGDRFDVLRGPVKAWIAIGSSHAVGVIFAYGGIAVAPLSFGGIAIGLLPFGAISLGVVSLGAIAVGVWSYGALAIGWQTIGGCSFAWNAAFGGIAWSRDYAFGGLVHAAQANTDKVKEFFQQSLFFRWGQILSRHGLWLMLASIIPVCIQSRVIRRARLQREHPPISKP